MTHCTTSVEQLGTVSRHPGEDHAAALTVARLATDTDDARLLLLALGLLLDPRRRPRGEYGQRSKAKR